jgi:predicted nuclease with TOPRIM domain
MALFIFFLFVFLVGYISYLKSNAIHKMDQLVEAHAAIEKLKNQIKLIEKEASLPKNKFSDSEYTSLKDRYNQLEIESEKYKHRLSTEVDFHNRLKRTYKDLENRFIEIENELKPFLVLNDLDKEINKRNDELNELVANNAS